MPPKAHAPSAADRAPKGVRIVHVEEGSAADAAGILPGDTLVSVNGHRVRDVIDYLFHRGDPVIEILVHGPRGAFTLEVDQEETGWADPGLVLEDFRVKACNNKCLFCFVAQLPRGMRRTLYIRDDDFRMSFLYGNYVTLTNLTDADRGRIVEQRLSPMYISVHATDDAVRRELLCRPAARPVMDDLRFFRDHRIMMHTQIVLCPGYNDGPVLARTLKDLCALYPAVQSVAVVPVGLTAYHNPKLAPMDSSGARAAIRATDAMRARCMKKHADPVVYAADEMYLKAGIDLPGVEYYGEFAQVENGVGMLPLFLHEVSTLRIKGRFREGGPRYLMVTGKSFEPFLKKFCARLGRKGLRSTVVGAGNRTFGPSVTVAGLLTGGDLAAALAPHAGAHDVVLVPDVMLREGERVFLDDMSVEQLGQKLGLRAYVVESSVAGVLDGIEETGGLY